MLGHGAGGGIEAPDLLAARAAAIECGLAVARVEQPYRVAGRRSPPPARQLDLAWAAAVAELAGIVDDRLAAARRRPLLRRPRRLPHRGGRRRRRRALPGLPAQPAAPAGTPSRTRHARPAWASWRPSTVPVLVVQGRSDRFGVPHADAGPRGRRPRWGPRAEAGSGGRAAGGGDLAARPPVRLSACDRASADGSGRPSRAGDGNRTRPRSLEGSCATTTLRPRAPRW